MRKGGSNWVQGDEFFGREIELEALEERVRDGTHTLLTAPRRMGKTSLVRELLRRLGETNEFETVFVDLEATKSPADAVAELGVHTKSVQGVWGQVKTDFANLLKAVGNQIDELSASGFRVKMRAGIDAGNWAQRGDAVFLALARNKRPIVLAIDELPILVNRLLKDDNGRIIPEGRQEADMFLSWLRRNGQNHRGQVSIILLGSVGLGPILEQAGLSTQANIYSTFDLKPWSEETASSYLKELSNAYGVVLPLEVRQSMCRRLRCCIPHHVQMFFDKFHDYLRRENRGEASLNDLDWVYEHEMLGVRRMDLQHYEGRLKTIFGKPDYLVALEVLTYTAIHSDLDDDTVRRYEKHFSAQNCDDVPSVEYVLHVLHHNGYLERQDRTTSQFASGLLKDWWSNRYGQNFIPTFEQRKQDRRAQQ